MVAWTAACWVEKTVRLMAALMVAWKADLTADMSVGSLVAMKVN